NDVILCPIGLVPRHRESPQVVANQGESDPARPVNQFQVRLSGEAESNTTEDGMAFGVDLSGRNALVTGGSRGIGRAIALALAECGAAVAVNFRTRAEEADAVVERIRSAGGHAIAIRADVSLGAEVFGLAERVARDLGPIDILINNAGVAIA